MSREEQIMEKREKVAMELDKLHKRVDEFNDHGEVDMIEEYVKDIRLVQKCLSDVAEQITWLKKVEFLWENCFNGALMGIPH